MEKKGKCNMTEELPFISLLKLELIKRNPHEEVMIQKSVLPDPEAVGFKKALGEPKGQRADYSYPLENGGRIHLLDYGDHYRAHRDNVDPDRDPIGHLIYDSPRIALALGAIVGGLLGKSSSKGDKTEGFLCGALIGLLLTSIFLAGSPPLKR
ncbi:MAG: hypothetical protein C0179_04120 [Fervidicoccus sp.]|nr:MAG: hypothetical protein C0179_04120 [Fervidicoccus sp.]